MSKNKAARRRGRNPEGDPEEPPDQEGVHRKRKEHPDAKRPKIGDEELDGMVAAAWDANWWCEKKGKHVKCYPPSGREFVTVAGTPGDWRTGKNTRRHFRRLGLAI